MGLPWLFVVLLTCWVSVLGFGCCTAASWELGLICTCWLGLVVLFVAISVWGLFGLALRFVGLYLFC